MKKNYNQPQVECVEVLGGNVMFSVSSGGNSSESGGIIEGE